MQRIFIQSWISCLDESMSAWINKFACPGFVFCPRKPHPKGNEYHTICCGESGIVYDWETVEGRDHPIPMGRPEFETSTNMKTVLIYNIPLRSQKPLSVITSFPVLHIALFSRIMSPTVFILVLVSNSGRPIGMG